MNRKSLTRNNKIIKQPKRILDGTKLTDAKGIAKQAFNADNISGTVSSMAEGLGNVIKASMANGKVDTTSADNAIEAVKSYSPAASTLDSLADSFMFKQANTNNNFEDFTVSTGEGLANMGKAGLSGFTTGLKTGGIWGGIAGLVAGLGSSGGAWLGGRSKAKREAERLNREAEIANLQALNTAEDTRDDINNTKMNNLLINRVAYGGPLYSHQGDWSNGLIFVDEGGTHEENPMEGVLMGFDQQGIPNLVEEGEIIYNDYVFSNRLKPTKKQLESVGLNTKYDGWTFAKIVEDLQKPSAETPLDKISMDSLDDTMNTMMKLQEEIRMKKGLTGQNRLMKFGGRKYAGLYDINPELLEEDSVEQLDYSMHPDLAPVGVIPGRKVNRDVLSIANIGSLLGNASTKERGNTMLNAKSQYRLAPKFNQSTVTIDNSAMNKILDDTLNNFDFASMFPADKKGKSIKKIVSKYEPSKKNYVEKLEAENYLKGDNKSISLLENLGMVAPTLDSLGKTISNAITPVDKSNFIAEDANRKRSKAKLGRITVRPKYEGIDQNAYISNIVNQGRATASDIRNIGTTGSDVLNRLALNAFNTQTATGRGMIDISNTDYARRQQYDNILAELQKANIGIDQAEFNLNAPIEKDIALGKIQDALAIENAENARLEALDANSLALAQDAADFARQGIEWNWIKNNPQYAEAVAALHNKRANGGMLTKKKRRK